MENAPSKEIILRDLRALGIQAGNVLLVHSSLKSLGFVPGGPAEVILALQEALMPQGSLVMPTFTFAAINGNNPRFEVRKTPSGVGKITESFRTMPGVMRSLHPTHSVGVWGRDAAAMTAGHERFQTPCAMGSPFSRIVERKGKILFLGVTTEFNTMLHGVEEWAGTQTFTTEPEPLEVVDYSGQVIPVPSLRHTMDRSAYYRKMEPLYLREGIMKTGRVGPAECRLVDSARMTEFTLKLLKRYPSLFTNNDIPSDA